MNIVRTSRERARSVGDVGIAGRVDHAARENRLTTGIGENRIVPRAIALAINGVPIFNALNNRGDDAFFVRELDEFGGHCGRTDDYRYHVAPLHLQETVGAP